MIEVVGRMMLALGVVLGIMWLLAKWARKPLAGKSGQVLGVIARQQLSRGASVAVIKVADRALVLGVTEQSVQLLTETDLAAVEHSLAVAESAPSRRTRATLSAAQDDQDDQDDRNDWDDWDAEILAPADELPAALVAAVGTQGASHRAATRTLRDRTSRARTLRDRNTQAPTSRDRTSRARTSRPAATGPLDGSILSPKVWAQLMQGARDLTVRR